MVTETTPASTSADVALAWQGRPAVAVIDLDALAGNIEVLKGMVGPDVRLMAVVKANAYGHGAIPVTRAALEAGAEALGVATVDEGAQLRMSGIEAPILVFGAIGRVERAQAIGQGLALVIADAGFARGLAAEVRAALHKEPHPVHLKIDTGMNRFGAEPGDVVDLARTITACPELRLEGIMTHQAAADAPDPSAAHRQVAVFDEAVRALREAGIEAPIHHVANSATTLRFPEYRRGQVRAGIAIYGLDPDPGLPVPPPMRPVMTIHARIMRVFDIQPGEAVGYGGTYRPERVERAGLVTLGYADGYRRAFSNVAHMGVRGQPAPVIGRVSMDQTVVRLPDGLDVDEGEPVAVVGDGTGATAGAPTFNDLAGLIGTIPYELACGIAPRMPRLYVQGGRVVAIADLFGLRELG